MFKFHNKLILFFIAYFIIIINIDASRIIARYIPMHECTEQEICINISECPYFNKKNLHTPSVHKIFKERFCGIKKRGTKEIPKVCCDKSTSSSEPSDEYQQLQSHRNFHKLPMDICGYVEPFTKRIINGNKAVLEEFPWMALIAFHEPGIFHCGGTIINEKFILTAAHCAKDTIIGVRLGEYEIKKPWKSGQDPPDCDNTGYCSPTVQDIPVKKVLVHPDFDSKTLQNDIALIELNKSANFNHSNVKPICLPITESNDDLSGKFAVVTGWGHTTEEGVRSPVLLKASVKVISNSDCKKIYKSSINSNQTCAGGNQGRDTCYGDSGGPLMSKELFDETERYFQYGITSFGPSKCGIEGKPGVYTRIRSYLKWILDNIGD